MQHLIKILQDLAISNDHIENLLRAGFRSTLDVLHGDLEVISQKSAVPFVIVRRIRWQLLRKFARTSRTAEDVFNESQKEIICLKFSIGSLDEVFRDVLRKKQIVEICGGPLTGKTQLCENVMLKAVCVDNWRVLWIDTCAQFSSRRLRTRCQQLGYSSQKVDDALKKICIIRLTNIFRLLQFFDFLSSSSSNFAEKQKYENYDVIIIDSVYSILSPWIGGKIDVGYGLMNQLAIAMKEISSLLDTFILYTNLASVSPIGSTLEANLGAFWQSVPDTRIGLQVSSKSTSFPLTSTFSANKIIHASLLKCRNLPVGSHANFVLTKSGIQDADIVQ